MTETAKIPEKIGEVCKWGYTLLDGTSKTGYALLKTPKGLLVVYENAWAKGEKRILGPSKDEGQMISAFKTISLTGKIPQLVKKAKPDAEKKIVKSKEVVVSEIPEVKSNTKEFPYWMIKTDVKGKSKQISIMETPEGKIEGTMHFLIKMRELWHRWNGKDLQATIININKAKAQATV